MIRKIGVVRKVIVSMVLRIVDVGCLCDGKNVFVLDVLVICLLIEVLS